MLKGLWGYVLFFVLSLGVAYWATRGGGERDELAREWIALGEKDIATVAFKEKGLNVVVESKPFGHWVAVSEQKKKKPDSEETETVSEAFKANSEIKELVSSLDPLVAERVIGGADKVDLKEFGLDEDVGEWTITTKSGKTYHYQLGKRSYGSRNVFVLDKDKNQVIMISGAPLELLRNARTRLYERDIIHVDDEKLNALTLDFQGAKARWVLGEKDKAGVPQWREDKDGSAPQASYRTWIEKILKSKLQRFAGPEELSALASVEPFLTVAFQGEGGVLGQVVFKKHGAAKDDASQPQIWVESTYLGEGVAAELHPNRAVPIEKDIEAILKTRS